MNKFILALDFLKHNMIIKLSKTDCKSLGKLGNTFPPNVSMLPTPRYIDAKTTASQGAKIFPNQIQKDILAAQAMFRCVSEFLCVFLA